MPSAILRLHGSWDTEAGRAWCRDVPELVATKTDAAFYRGRNVLFRLESPTGPVVVKAFGRGKWWRPARGLGKAGLSYDGREWQPPSLVLPSWHRALAVSTSAIGMMAAAACGTSMIASCLNAKWTLWQCTWPASTMPRCIIAI